MADVAVIVPWRAGCPHREAAWSWVRDRYAAHHPDWQIVEGVCPEGPWVKALAVADGLARTDAPTIVIADADVWCDHTPVAVAAVQQDRQWAIPHRAIRRLRPEGTTAVLAGEPFDRQRLLEHTYRAHVGGGIIAIRRSTYQQVPLDPRFVGWGHEDDAWGEALSTLVAQPVRAKGYLWHLWHPPQDRKSRRRGTDESVALLRRYWAASHDRAAMGQLVDEARQEAPCR